MPGDLVIATVRGGDLYLVGLLLSVEFDPCPLYDSPDAPDGHTVYRVLDSAGGGVRTLRWIPDCGLEIRRVNSRP